MKNKTWMALFFLPITLLTFSIPGISVCAERFLPLSYVGSSYVNGFTLDDSANSLMVINSNHENHYCTSLPDRNNAYREANGANFDDGLLSYQSVLYSTESGTEYQTLFSQLVDCKNLKSLYLEVDPLSIGFQEYDYFKEFLESHPDLRVHFCLPVYANDYYLSFISAGQSDLFTSSYSSFCQAMFSYDNVSIFFPGMEYYVISNKNCFGDSQNYTWETANYIADEILKGKYELSHTNYKAELAGFVSSVHYNSMIHFPDFSGKKIAIFGDSINGNFAEPFSIASFIHSMTGATIYNFSIGGATAYSDPSSDTYPLSFYSQILGSVGGDLSTFHNTNFINYQNYVTFDHNTSFDTIIIEYGLNDYFFNFKIDNPDNPTSSVTVKGGFRRSINDLQRIYPDAKFYVVIPTHITILENGTENLEGNGTLEDYITAIREIAEEYDLSVIDCYQLTNLDSYNFDAYTLDGVHPSTLGRYELAKYYIRSME